MLMHTTQPIIVWLNVHTHLIQYVEKVDNCALTSWHVSVMVRQLDSNEIPLAAAPFAAAPFAAPLAPCVLRRRLPGDLLLAMSARVAVGITIDADCMQHTNHVIYPLCVIYVGFVSNAT